MIVFSYFGLVTLRLSHMMNPKSAKNKVMTKPKADNMSVCILFISDFVSSCCFCKALICTCIVLNPSSSFTSMRVSRFSISNSLSLTSLAIANEGWIQVKNTNNKNIPFFLKTNKG